MKQKFLSIIAAALLAFPLQVSAAPVKIGFINSITGKEAQIGENLTNGAAMAIEDLKAKGIQVELVREDDGGDPKNALAAYEKLVTRDAVIGVVGPYTSGCANVVASRADQYKVPLLVPAAAKEEITMKGYKNVFRLNAPANVYSSVLMKAVAPYKPKTIAYVYAATDFGVSTVKTAQENALKMGLKEVANEKYQQGQPDYRSSLAKVKAANPDLVFLVSYDADAILLMRQAREIGLTPKAFLGAGAGYTTAQFAQQTEISNLVISATQWTDDVNWPGAADFAVRYKAKYAKEPSYHAACAYEAMRIMAITASATKSAVKLQAALKGGYWNGIMGPVKFADYGGFTNQNNHPMLVQQIANGKYETVYPAQFSKKKLIYPFKR
ncbi:ABC transporter substrate-binding protein [Pelodictyon phaeoclathratiforme]|jgi:branched-chain amino acid transport system substrate-binding protein|uniref:Extracellular ligand-binding receptor n=1 Tax=Pelodictyon phaeoclathratiforme (strain DSM 5477 / BU-1) TaxID=324925 RepID=B4SBK7_PELPB|nr:ABC transporter substrate-binding protein [Pelodictyon phaeoclathratiforme]ACF44061.1 Extracellular ligand-binding receptor [Pelodictyon phaeoclathratiforme BU-1]MBV5288258.1 ABC transporter substrate-binding protein [Pelodictyon phaeoclathratiforme]